MKRWCVAMTLIFAGSAWCQDADADRQALEGTWKAVAAELAGTKLAGLVQQTTLLTIADGKYSVQVDKSIDKGTLKIDSAAKPKTMDIVGTDGPNKGKTMLAIYEVQKDALRICYDLQGKNRPTEFTTSKENPYLLIVYHRAKK